MRKFWSAALIYLSISGISLMTANAQETAEPMPPSVADQDAETETKPLEPIAETQWPQVFPPLNVLITPRRDRIEPEDDTAQDGPAEWAQVPLANGRAGDLLGFLNTRIDHKADWQADETFIAAQKALRLDEKEPDTRQALVERANMAVIMGGGFLHMSMAQIFVNFGFEPDGTRPKPNPYGVLSPIDPVTCHEGGISCRQSTIPN